MTCCDPYSEENGNSIACDGCNIWNNTKCINMDKDTFKMFREKYIKLIIIVMKNVN